MSTDDHQMSFHEWCKHVWKEVNGENTAPWLDWIMDALQDPDMPWDGTHAEIRAHVGDPAASATFDDCWTRWGGVIEEDDDDDDDCMCGGACWLDFD